MALGALTRLDLCIQRSNGGPQFLDVLRIESAAFPSLELTGEVIPALLKRLEDVVGGQSEGSSRAPEEGFAAMGKFGEPKLSLPSDCISRLHNLEIVQASFDAVDAVRIPVRAPEHRQGDRVGR